MTDRHAGYVVVLQEDLREDDAAQTLSAIQQIKGVISVVPIVADLPFALAQSRVRWELHKKLLGVLHDLTD